MRARRKTVGGAEAPPFQAVMNTSVRLIQLAPWLKDRGQEAAGPQFGDQQAEIPHPGGQRAGQIDVEEAEPILLALMAQGTEEGGDLQLDPLLQAMAG